MPNEKPRPLNSPRSTTGERERRSTTMKQTMKTSPAVITPITTVEVKPRSRARLMPKVRQASIPKSSTEPGNVEAFGSLLARRVDQQPPGEHGGEQAERHARPEDRAPVQQVDQHAAQDRSRRRAGPDGRDDQPQSGASSRRREGRRDDRRAVGHRHRRADRLQHARAHQLLQRTGNRRQERGHGEEDEAPRVEHLAPVEVAEAAHRQRQPGADHDEGQRHPDHVVQRPLELVLQRGQRDVRDRVVHHAEERPDADHESPRPSDRGSAPAPVR